ncbi:LysR family transcriptional regulator [Acidisoma cellulosilytica]|uniref:LysR family transcriptional regulator n=1 Tax=Acidisoma cellulosilyticum TaxID=2802395 RepID=A0A964E1V5_9PROT|nr:LysR substrate-binding domain-containing protein [Acidisoma cellulosilyticum]MCB8878642.1 LysR family transcriptional regulator [Acidisoma cellulosilyticum]
MSEWGFAGLSLRDLEYAIAVADLRHFGKAAERCGVSQPALSEQIRKLEAVLRVTLFERSRKSVEVTVEGAAILRQARAVLREARGLFDVARSHGDPLAGPLRLGVIPTLGPYYLPLVLQSLRGAFPALALRLEEGMTDQILDRLQANSLDLVLIALPEPMAGLSTEALFFEPFQIVAPESHPIAHLNRITVEDLRGEDFLLLEEGHCLRDQAVALCGSHPRRAGRFASSLEMLRHMIAAGEGFALLPALSVKDRPDLDGLAAIRPVEAIEMGEGQAPTLPGRTIGLVWRSRDPRNTAFRRLAGFLRGHAPQGTQAAPDPAPEADPAVA